MNHTSKVIPRLRLFDLFECQDASVTGDINDDFLDEEFFQDASGLSYSLRAWHSYSFWASLPVSSGQSNVAGFGDSLRSGDYNAMHECC